KVNLKPDSEVADVISWYSGATCTPILVSSGTALAGKKVTILSPEPITFAELRRLFHAALDSVGLAAEPDGKFLRIVDAAHARPGERGPVSSVAEGTPPPDLPRPRTVGGGAGVAGGTPCRTTVAPPRPGEEEAGGGTGGRDPGSGLLLRPSAVGGGWARGGALH